MKDINNNSTLYKTIINKVDNEIRLNYAFEVASYLNVSKLNGVKSLI